MRPHQDHISLRVVVAVLAVGVLSLMAHPASASVRANYVETAAWETGYQAEYRITNDGPGDVSSWTVVFDLPTNNQISSSWDSAFTRAAQRLIFRNASWNGSLAPGASTSFGFVVVGVTRPANCTVNGGPCDTLAPLARAPHRSGAAATRITYREPAGRMRPSPGQVLDAMQRVRTRSARARTARNPRARRASNAEAISPRVTARSARRPRRARAGRSAACRSRTRRRG
jgi:hypothetical protein